MIYSESNLWNRFLIFKHGTFCPFQDLEAGTTGGLAKKTPCIQEDLKFEWFMSQQYSFLR